MPKIHFFFYLQQKNTPFEGGIHTAAAIWSPLFKSQKRVSHQLIHVTDLLPTFAHLAGVPVNDNVDGLNIWDALSMNTTSPRREILGQFDINEPQHSAYIRDDWKYINGTTYNGLVDDWLGNISTTEIHESMYTYGLSILESPASQAFASVSLDKGSITASDINRLRNEAIYSCKNVKIDLRFACRPLKAPCLFNLKDDPCERYNLASVQPQMMQRMQTLLENFRGMVKPMRNQPTDKRADPKNFNGTWTWWYDELGLGNVASKRCWPNFFILVCGIFIIGL